MARIRIKRLESELQKIISNVINFKLRDKNLVMVTVTEIKLTNDLSYANIYYTHFDNFSREKVLSTLEKSSGVIKHEIAKAKFMRKIPNLVFRYDEMERKARDIDDIFAKIHSEKTAD